MRLSFACGGGSAPPPFVPTSILYVDAGGVRAFAVNSDGSLSRLSDPQNLGIGGNLAATKSFLFAGHLGTFSTDLLSVNAAFIFFFPDGV